MRFLSYKCAFAAFLAQAVALEASPAWAQVAAPPVICSAPNNVGGAVPPIVLAAAPPDVLAAPPTAMTQAELAGECNALMAQLQDAAAFLEHEATIDCIDLTQVEYVFNALQHYANYATDACEAAFPSVASYEVTQVDGVLNPAVLAYDACWATPAVAARCPLTFSETVDEHLCSYVKIDATNFNCNNEDDLDFCALDLNNGDLNSVNIQETKGICDYNMHLTVANCNFVPGPLTSVAPSPPAPPTGCVFKPYCGGEVDVQCNPSPAGEQLVLYRYGTGCEVARTSMNAKLVDPQVPASVTTATYVVCTVDAWQQSTCAPATSVVINQSACPAPVYGGGSSGGGSSGGSSGGIGQPPSHYHGVLLQ